MNTPLATGGAAERAGVLVCFAVREEEVAFRPIRPSHVEILVTGMGPSQARRGIEARLGGDRPRPGLVLTCGFAGGLAPDLEPGAVVFDVDVGLAELAVALKHAGARPARILCTDRVAILVAEKQRLRESTGADAVEMESGIIRGICRERGIPSATVRVISDAAGHDLPVDFNALMTADYRLHYGRLAWAILKSPRIIGGLRQLQQRCRVAAGSLARVLARAVAVAVAVPDGREPGRFSGG